MLREVLAPMSTAEFFARYWAKQFVQISGTPDKLVHFFPWDVLNRVLEQHRFAADQLILVKGGEKVDSGLYRDRDSVYAAGLTRELDKGATLILNCCDAAHPPLRKLCACLERIFHVDVYANLYAGWHRDNCFDVHWDDQDNLILQVAGHKWWRVWQPTRTFPFTRDIVDTSSRTRPTGTPIWEGVLEQGSVLSIPRGWWHVAFPMEEPCLHLTITIPSLTGIGLLHWFVNQMKASEVARMPLPLVCSEQERRAWLESLFRDLTSAWRADLIDQYLANVDLLAKARPVFALPDISGLDAVAVQLDTLLELSTPRPLVFHEVGTKARFVAAETVWEVSTELVRPLANFNDGEPHMVSELLPNTDGATLSVLQALVMRGVLRKVRLPGAGSAFPREQGHRRVSV